MATTNVIPGERWAPITGYEGLYSVSDHGRVRRETTATNRRAGWHIKPSVSKALGYARVNLHRDGGQTTLYVHRLVAEAFIGPCPPDAEVNHRDGSKANNVASNLEYLTHAENGQHARDTGLANPARGKSNARTKLSEADVRRLRRNALAPRSKVRQLAESMGVTERQAVRVMKGERWQHLAYLPGEHVRRGRS